MSEIGADGGAAPVSIGILTVSDRAFRGEYEDRGGPAVQTYLDAMLVTAWRPLTKRVPDERDVIEESLRRLCDIHRCCLVLTTGGTGIAPRDVTPEATLAVADKELPGFGEIMRAVSVAAVPTAILSRQTAVVRGRSLIINLPGSPKAVCECLDAIFAAVPHGIDQMGGPILEIRSDRLVTDMEIHS